MSDAKSTRQAALDFLQRRPDHSAKAGAAPREAATDAPVSRPVPSFSGLPAYKRAAAQKRVGELLAIEDPFFRPHEGAAGANTVIDGQSFSNFTSYDYLGLNQDVRLRAAAAEAISVYGVSASASRLVAGERPVHRELETRIAEFHGVPAALTMVSGYLTNVAAISCLMGPGDLVLHDALIHNSILTGAATSGAARRSFRHNDMADLERLLHRLSANHRRVLVVVEGLYSMDGDIADLPRLIELRSKFGFWLMVDEAHAVGVLGDTGRGSAEHFGIDPHDVDIWMGTLSKSTAACGGYIAGSSALIDSLKASAGGFVYSVAMPPMIAAAASKAFEIMVAEPEATRQLRERSRRLLGALQAEGLDTGLSEGYAVIPVMIGNSLEAATLSQALREKSINVLPIIFPAVPEGSARLRFFVNRDHTDEQIDEAAAATASALADIRKRGIDLSAIDPRDIISSLEE